MSTLRARLFTATLAALALTIALTIGIGAVLVRREVDRTQGAALASRADDLASQRRNNVSYVNQNKVSNGIRVIVSLRRELAVYVPDVNRSSDGTTTYAGAKMLYSYRTIPSRGLLLLRPAGLPSSEWAPFLRGLLIAALAGAAFAAAVSFLVARSIVRPIRRVASAARELADDELPQPLPAAGAREVASLAQAFNDMTSRLVASRQAERAFLLSVSHELKTPLTAIRGYAEGLAEGAFDSEEASATILKEAGRLERLVHDLLDLARMNRSEFAVRSEPVDLAALARETATRHEATARQFDVTLEAAGGQSWVGGDHDRLLQVAGNLVENALRETPAGGRVTVTAAPGRLTVADSGPGIAPADLPHVFERFYLYDRAGRDRSVGSGLGLAIVKQLVEAMRGTVSVTSGPSGTTFAVDLPPLGPQPARVDDLEVGARQGVERV